MNNDNREFSTPVWFALDGEKVVLVPNIGSVNNWFKDLANDPQIELSVDRSTTNATKKDVM
ncbi:MAG: hypothetical protein ABSE82_10825 [Nitrososphaerales archaeon]